MTRKSSLLTLPIITSHSGLYSPRTCHLPQPLLPAAPHPLPFQLDSRLSCRPSIQQPPFYIRGVKAQNSGVPEGKHGMVDCETLYYSPFSSPYPYSVPTTALRAQNADTLYTEWNAASAVRNLGHAVGL